MKALKRAYFRKQKYLRNSLNPNRFDALFHEQKGRCYYCNHSIFTTAIKDTRYKATIEHKTPISRGGNNSKKNIVLACQECNQKKGNLTEEEFITNTRAEALASMGE